MTILAKCLTIAAVLLTLEGYVMAGLCPNCKDLIYIASVGKCVNCGGQTCSGAFALCKQCSEKLNECEHCRAKLGDTGQKTPPPASAPAATTATQPAGDAITIDEASDGKTIAASVGQRIVIRLKGNPTTGYSWIITKFEGDALGKQPQVQYVPDEVKDRRVGVGGTFVVQMQAAKAGSVSIAMQYARPWEKNTPPIQTFSVTIEVKK
jgi:inhibitor of cysteine peptidase